MLKIGQNIDPTINFKHIKYNDHKNNNILLVKKPDPFLGGMKNSHLLTPLYFCKNVSFKQNLETSSQRAHLTHEEMKFIKDLDNYFELSDIKKRSSSFLILEKLGKVEQNIPLENNFFKDNISTAQTFRKISDLNKKFGKENTQIKRLYEFTVCHLVLDKVSQKYKPLKDHTVNLYNASQVYGSEFEKLFYFLQNEQRKIAQKLGINDLLKLYSIKAGCDISQLNQVSLEMLDNTDELYWNSINNSLLRNNLTLKKEHVPYYIEVSMNKNNHDLKYYEESIRKSLFSRSDELEKTLNTTFFNQSVMGLVNNTFDGMGLDFSQKYESLQLKTIQDYLRFIQRPNPESKIYIHLNSKYHNPHCSFIKIPEKIIVSVPPQSDYLKSLRAYLHECAHAYHTSLIDKNQPAVNKIMLSDAVTEAYAFLFDALISNKHWLQESQLLGLSEKDADLLSRQNILNTLFTFRSLACANEFELYALNHKEFPEYSVDKNMRLKKINSVNSLEPIDRCEFLAKSIKRQGMSNDSIYNYYRNNVLYKNNSQNHLLGLILKAQLEEYLVNKFGECWYKNTDAGYFLRQLWQKGALKPDELSKTIGYESCLDTTPLMRYFKKHLS